MSYLEVFKGTCDPPRGPRDIYGGHEQNPLFGVHLTFGSKIKKLETVLKL